jgi:hypothetical protein
MSRLHKGNEDTRSGASRDTGGSSATAKVVEPDPQAAQALRKIARLFPAGFSLSVKKAATIGRIELVCSSDKQWKKFPENDSPTMLRFTVERLADGQLIVKRITEVKQKPKANGHGQSASKGNGQEKPARTGSSKRKSRNNRPEEITLSSKKKLSKRPNR